MTVYVSKPNFILRDELNKLSWTKQLKNHTKLVVSDRGNLGVDVTPSMWQSGTTAIEWDSGAIWARGATSGSEFVTNAYFNGTSWLYLQNGTANRYQQQGGIHSWWNAPSGNAGNIAAFTPRMVLDAEGNLGVGIFGGTRRFEVWGTPLGIGGDGTGALAVIGNNSTAFNSSPTAALTFWTRYNSAGNTFPMATVQAGKENITDGNFAGYLSLQTTTAVGNSTERVRITSAGDLLVGTQIEGGVGISLFNPANNSNVARIDLNKSASGASTGMSFRHNGTEAGAIVYSNTDTIYVTTSDYRLKDNPQPLTNSGTFIDALQPKTWNWKVDGSKGVGFIAHEAQAVSPGSVTGTKDAVDSDGRPVMQAMEYGSAEFIANIIAELQSLRARMAALETKD